jgi:hypothetical protein
MKSRWKIAQKLSIFPVFQAEVLKRWISYLMLSKP